jgi:vacuolar iron transporter family protein
MDANDGIVSTASLLVGFAAARTSRADVLLAGAAGLVAGAMSMAAGDGSDGRGRSSLWNDRRWS